MPIRGNYSKVWQLLRRVWLMDLEPCMMHVKLPQVWHCLNEVVFSEILINN